MGSERRVSVCIPYRERDEHAAVVVARVQRQWRRHFPFEIVVADSPGDGPFNRAAARNAAAAEASGDTLIFCDADTVFVDAQHVTNAIDVARQGGWTLPELYIQASREWTMKHLDGVINIPTGRFAEDWWDDPLGGIIVVQRSALELVRGWDEGFTSWGWEDKALRDSLDVLVAEHERVGTVVHLWHERAEEITPSHPDVQQNRYRWQRIYMPARRLGPEAMRQAIDGARDGWAASA